METRIVCEDPLSIGENPSTHAAVATNRGSEDEDTILRIDDLSVMRFRVESVQDKELEHAMGNEER